ncbi:MAG TPA: outer membrane beta-barrel protein [Burkholderiales bacterium]|nr:outer membrane beta-barrel protein [Burkholderiales bacterium]
MRTSGFQACLFALAVTLASLPAIAQAPTGAAVVESLKGDLTAGTGRLAEGARVDFPATLRTGPGAQALLTFGDGMQVLIDEKSQLRVLDFRQTGTAARAVMDLSAGAARFVTPEENRLFVRTPEATLEAASASDFSLVAGAGTHLSVERGAVTASSQRDKVQFGPSSAGVIRGWGSLPERVPAANLPAAVSSTLARLGNVAVAVVPPPPEPDVVDRWRKGAYLGASIGRSRFKENIAIGPLIDSGEVQTNSTGFKIFGGYQFVSFLAAEVAYVDLGKAKYQGTFGGAPVGNGEVKASGVNFSAVGTLPLGDAVLFGKVGVFAWETGAADDAGTGGFSAKASGGDLSYGAGAGYNFKSGFGLRAELEKFKIGSSSATLLSLGALYRF